MSKMLMASLLAAAACGNVTDPTEQGAGSDASVPTTCTSAEECGDGDACDLTAHECVTGRIEIDATDFVVDGSIWWTSTDGPTLRGTHAGPGGAAIEVKVGTSQGLPATLTGAAWSLALPASSIASSDTLVTIVMTDPSGGRIERAQAFRVDAAPPAIALGPSKVRDERGDSIDFTSGEPVHAHVGVEVDLAGSECPTVHKYAYLMDATDPAFGRQTTTNPLAWRFSIAEAKLTSAAYRVRDAASATVLDWTSLVPVAAGSYVVELHRNGVPGVAELGTTAGSFFVDVRARDWAGNESTATWCWNHQPLAAPLEIQAATASPLLAMSLPADSPISRLLTYTGSVEIVSQRIVQATAEPIRIEVGSSANAPLGRYSKTVVQGDVPLSPVSGSCDLCELPPPPTVTSSSGDLTEYSVTTGLVDEVTGGAVPLDVHGTATIPPRGADEPPHAYRVVVQLGQVASLRPAPSSSYGEFALGGLVYTGTPPSAQYAVCTDSWLKCNSYGCVEICRQETTFANIVAIDRATLELDPIAIDLATSAGQGLAASVPPYISPDRFIVGPITWDAGDDDLPGPY